ncbi:hypothetical protein MMC30_004636 [Trapelia coarctata]|nr:hypothetical protein [Trapelia coarctata]
MHTPLDITAKALEYVNVRETDSVVSIGGGSAIVLGKAISIRTGLPHICIPTTYGGSKMTSHLGESANGQKETRSDLKILPGTVIYDVELTMTLPAAMSAMSDASRGIRNEAGLDTAEALYGQNKNPLACVVAQKGIRAVAASLPKIMEDPLSQSARWDLLYGAWLCGSCLGTVSTSFHHKLCHTLGGSFSLPRSETHTIVLPHVLSYLAPNIPQALERLAHVLPESNGDAIIGLNALLTKLKVKRSLREFGMKEGDIDRTAEIALSKPYRSPRKLERDGLRELIRQCWAGEEARVEF